MKRFLGLLATGALALSISSAADAQVVRGLGAGAIILDDNLGHKVTITAPQFGTPEWTAWSNAFFPNLTWSVPVPPASGAQSGFVLTGPLTPAVGPYPATRQLTYWIYPNQADNTTGSIVNGGPAGTWNSASTLQLGLLTAPAALALNVIPKSDGAGNLIPSGFTDNGTTVATTENATVAGTLGVTGATTLAGLTAGATTLGNTTTGTLGSTTGTFSGVVNSNGGIANTGTITSTGNISTSAGNISSSGSLSAGTTVTAGTGITSTTGNISASAGNVAASGTVTGGTGVTATTGNVAASAGNVSASGTVTGGTGVTATTGNVAASAGNVSASGTVTGGTGVTATTGNVAASAGNVSASGTVTGGTGVTATTGNVTATAGNINATAGALQTAGTTRIDNSGNGTLGTLTTSGLATTNAGHTNVGAFTTSGGAANINATTNGATNIGNALSTTTLTGPNVVITGIANVLPTKYLGVDASNNIITSNANVVTGSGTLNTIPKWNPAGSTLVDSKLNDDGTTLNYNAGKFTVTAANGNTSVGGTLGVTGATTLTNLAPTAGVVHNSAAGLLSSSAVNLASNGAGGDVTGITNVANGGTGVNTITANGVVLGAGASPVTTATGAVNQVLVAGAGGVPAFGAVPLNQAAAVSGVLPIANGGTNSGAALTGSAVAISNGTALVQGPAGTTTTLLHGNAAGAPTYGQVVNADIANATIDLTTKVTGVLPVANGGTNSSSFTGNTITVSNAGGTALVSGPAGTTTTVLHGNAGGAPSYGAVNLAAAGDVTGVLTVPNGGTGAATLATNGIVFGNGVGAVGVTAQGASNTFLRGNGAAAPTFGAVGLNTADVTGVLPIANGGTNSSAALTASAVAISNGTALVQGPVGSTTTVLHGNVAGAPTYGAVGLTTDVSGVLPVANGGTNSNSFSNNTITVSNAGGTALVSGPAGSTTTVLHGNAGGAPTYGAVGLTTDVTGVLPIANGGTNSSAALTASAIAVSNGTQLVQGPQGTTTTVLHGNAAGLPTYALLNLTTDVTGVLPVPNGGTGTASLTTNAVPYGNGVAAHGSTGASIANGQFLQTTVAGGAPTWATTLGTANGGTGSSTALVGSKIMISNAAGTAVVEANGISTNNASTTLTATSDITSSAGNLVSGKAPNTAGKLKLFDAAGNTATIQTGTPLSFANQTYTIRTNPGANTSTFALLEIPQTFTATQAVNAAIQSGTVGALDANNSYVAAAATDIAIGLTVNSIASSAVGGKNKGIVVNANNALGAGSDNIAIEIQSGRFVSSGTPATNANGMDLLTSTSGTGAALGISLANANGIISSVSRQGINSTSSSTTNGDYAVKGQVSTVAASTALAGQVDGVFGENLNQVAIGGIGQTADGNVLPAANGYRYAPSGVLAHGNASVTAGVGQYSTAIVIKDGAFAVSGIQPAGHITGKTFAVAPGTNVTIKNPLCTADSYILITPASATAATASLYISTVNDGSFVVTNAAGGSGIADANFNYFIINPVAR